MADPRNRVTLGIDGQLYEGWTEVSFDESLDTLAAAFRLTLTDREPGGRGRLAIMAGSECTLSIGGKLLLTGYVDEVEQRIDANEISIAVSGRDRAADLIDCSAVHSKGSWRATRIETIIEELAAPFGIGVSAEIDTGGPVRRFAVQQGETVFDAIERLARYRALLPISDSSGDIALVRPKTGSPDARIVQGETLYEGSARHGAADRFSQIIVKGQSSGDDQANGRAVAAVRGEARDPAMRRYRPLIVIGEEQSDPATLAARAQWEVTVRAARAQSADVTLVGWRDASGALWRRNRLVRLTAPALSIDADLLITAVKLRLDDQGSFAELTLAVPEAYSRQPISEKAALSDLEGAA